MRKENNANITPLPQGEFHWNSYDSQGYRCGDCRHLELDADAHGLRRCAYFGKWVRPSDPACGSPWI